MTEQPPDPQQPSYGQWPPPPPPPPYVKRGDNAQGFAAGNNPSSWGYAPKYPPRLNHRSATTALVLGILGVLFCPLVLSIPAWVIGRRTVHEIDDSRGELGGRGSAQAGLVLGIIGTVWAGLAALFVIVVFVFGGLIKSAYTSTCTQAGDNGSYATDC